MTTKRLGALIVILTIVSAFFLGIIAGTILSPHPKPITIQYLIPLYGPH